MKERSTNHNPTWMLRFVKAEDVKDTAWPRIRKRALESLLFNLEVRVCEVSERIRQDHTWSLGWHTKGLMKACREIMGLRGIRALNIRCNPEAELTLLEVCSSLTGEMRKGDAAKAYFNLRSAVARFDKYGVCK